MSLLGKVSRHCVCRARTRAWRRPRGVQGGDCPSQELTLLFQGCWREDPGGRGLRAPLQRQQRPLPSPRGPACAGGRARLRGAGWGGGRGQPQPRGWGRGDAALWPGLGIRPDDKGMESQSKT